MMFLNFDVQSYEKSRAIQNKYLFLLPRRSKFANFWAKVRKNESRTKQKICSASKTHKFLLNKANKFSLFN